MPLKKHWELFYQYTLKIFAVMMVWFGREKCNLWMTKFSYSELSVLEWLQHLYTFCASFFFSLLFSHNKSFCHLSLLSILPSIFFSSYLTTELQNLLLPSSSLPWGIKRRWWCIRNHIYTNNVLVKWNYILWDCIKNRIIFVSFSICRIKKVY